MKLHVRKLGWAGAAALTLAAGPALADVKAGVDAWSRGDYAVAVREWQGPAAAGDADALFNMGQAYRLGRGVPADEARAESYYAQAAAKGHIQAADTYGLMLFQAGRREAALPYVEDAARRGDPRSQYLLGIAYFNGDLVSKDWVKAYALLTLANASGLPQAAGALAQMDQNIPLAQRQQAAGLASQLRQQADAARGRELAAAELGGPDTGVTGAAPPRTAPPQVAAAPTGGSFTRPRLPAPIPQVAVSPSVAAARAAVAEASRVTGTESPADAGADYARPSQAAVPPPQQVAVSSPPASRPAPAPVQASASGPWRIQLGAFSVLGNAERLWTQLSRRPELAGKSRMLVPAGRVTKLQAGGFASQAAAEAACRTLKASGQECIATTR